MLDGWPRPRATTLTQPYWDAAARHELVLPRCEDCGRSFFRPEVVCTHCSSRRWTWVPSRGTGTVYSFSVVHRPMYQGMAVPYVVAAVDLDEGCTMFANVVECDPAEVDFGMRVKVTFVDYPEGGALPCFAPSAT